MRNLCEPKLVLRKSGCGSGGDPFSCRDARIIGLANAKASHRTDRRHYSETDRLHLSQENRDAVQSRTFAVGLSVLRALSVSWPRTTSILHSSFESRTKQVGSFSGFKLPVASQFPFVPQGSDGHSNDVGMAGGMYLLSCVGPWFCPTMGTGQDCHSESSPIGHRCGIWCFRRVPKDVFSQAACPALGCSQ